MNIETTLEVENLVHYFVARGYVKCPLVLKDMRESLTFYTDIAEKITIAASCLALWSNVLDGHGIVLEDFAEGRHRDKEGLSLSTLALNLEMVTESLEGAEDRQLKLSRCLAYIAERLSREQSVNLVSDWKIVSRVEALAMLTRLSEFSEFPCSTKNSMEDEARSSVDRLAVYLPRLLEKSLLNTSALFAMRGSPGELAFGRWHVRFLKKAHELDDNQLCCIWVKSTAELLSFLQLSEPGMVGLSEAVHSLRILTG